MLPFADGRAGIVCGVARQGASAVILTTGSRPSELTSAVDSSLRAGCQSCTVVWNADYEPLHADTAPDGVTFLYPGRNLGIPGGRNYGLAASISEVVGFLDDDAVLLSENAVRDVIEHFKTHSRCAVVALRIVDQLGVTSRRHNPRVGTAGVTRGGRVGTFLGGACFVRREAFVSVGGFDESFIYAMEEQDLTWRLYEAGWHVDYRPDIRAFHPRTDPSRHPNAVEQTWRNRVTSASKMLPLPIWLFYVTTHGARSIARGLSLRSAVSGLRRGVSHGRRSRCPMSWSTVWKLTCVGRPPIV